MTSPLNPEASAAGGAAEPEAGGVEPLYHGLRLAFGVFFLCSGLWLYWQVLSELNALLSGTPSYPLLEKFVSPEARRLTLPGTGEEISLPPVFFTGMGYGVIVFMASVVVSIGNNLIRGGVSLIQPDAKVLIRRLRMELGKKPAAR